MPSKKRVLEIRDNNVAQKGKRGDTGGTHRAAEGGGEIDIRAHRVKISVFCVR